MKHLETPLCWVGGKNRLKRFLVTLIPKHDIYAEPFFGAGHLLFWKEESKVEYIFDKDDLLINLWQVIKNSELNKQFLEFLTYHPTSRTLYMKYRDILKNPEEYKKLDLVTRAGMAYYIIKCSFGTARVFTGQESWGFSAVRGKNFSTFYNTIWSLIFERLKDVMIENRDFREFFELFHKADKDTFLYVDPPYFSTLEQKTYRFDFSVQDHRDLAKCLKEFGGNFMLSIDSCEESKQIYDGFNKIEIDNIYTVNNGLLLEDRVTKEFVITNYELPKIPTQQILFEL